MNKKIVFLTAGAIFSTLFLGGTFASAENDSELYEDKIVEYKELLEHTPTFTEKELSAGTADADDLRDPYQLSEDELTTLSTEELAKIVLAYPYLIDIYAFDSVHEGLQVVRSRYNGLDELLSREDAAEYLTQLYSEDSDEISARSVIFDFDVEYLEVILAQEEFQDDRDEITEAFSEAYDKKELSKVYEGSMDTYLSVLDEQGITLFASDTTTTVKTPKGTKVSVTKYGSDLSVTKKSQLNSSCDKAYPNAKRLAGATKMYNCHS